MKMSRLMLGLWMLAACSGGGEGDDDDGGEGVTYYQDVKPLIDAKCTGCHYDEGIAPFALTEYDQVKENGVAVELNVRLGIMPPWPPNPECNEYVADRSLTDEQKDLIAAWVDGGMLEGDPDNEAEPLDLETVSLSRVDLELEMEQEYMPNTTPAYPDEYRCFVLPFPSSIDTTTYVTGFRAVPGNPKVVHHVIAFYASPSELAQYQSLDAGEEGDGYTCFGGSGGPSRVMLGGWAPGGLGNDFPAGTGLAIEPGSAVILQVHYNVLEAGVQPDLTGIQMKLDSSVEKVAQIMPWANPLWIQDNGMFIPAGDPDVVHMFQYDATVLTEGQGFTIHSAATHQHNLGSQNAVRIERAGGGDTCLVQIDDWNFHWQGSYGLREPVHFAPGDQLQIECHWDNSPDNQPEIGGELAPPRDVYWGEDTQSEMCVAFFYVTPD